MLQICAGRRGVRYQILCYRLAPDDGVAIAPTTPSPPTRSLRPRRSWLRYACTSVFALPCFLLPYFALLCFTLSYFTLSYFAEASRRTLHPILYFILYTVYFVFDILLMAEASVLFTVPWPLILYTIPLCAVAGAAPHHT